MGAYIPPQSYIDNLPKDPFTGKTISQIEAQNYAEGKNRDGSPILPGYNPVYDPSSMSMLPELNQKLGALTLDKRGLDKFRTEALRTGPSSWSMLARKSQALGAQGAREKALRDAAGQTASAQSSLAMRGGIRSGARERLAKQGMKNYLDMSQDLNRQNDQDNLQIGMNDETNRIQQLGMLPGMEVASMQPDFQKLNLWGQGKQYDVNNAMGEGERKNAYNMDKYKTEGTMWGAKQQADATRSANSGSWLCTEAQVRDGIPRSLTRGLANLLRYAKEKDWDATRFYLRGCDELVRRMQKAKYDWDINTRFVHEVASVAASGEHEQAWQMYCNHVYQLIDQYWPECSGTPYRAEKARRTAFNERRLGA